VFIPIAVYLKYQPGFAIEQVWYVSILSVTIQGVASYLLVRRELRLKLDGLVPLATNAAHEDVHNLHEEGQSLAKTA
jgi:hypothetical protein